MESPPEIIPITDLRRDAAGVIARTVDSGAPAYVTQHGRFTAVLVSRHAYQNLLHRLAVLRSAAAADVAPVADVAPATTAKAQAGDLRESDAPGLVGSERRVARNGAAVTKRETLAGSIGWPAEAVATRFGMTDAETAAFLAIEGFGVGTGSDEEIRRR